MEINYDKLVKEWSNRMSGRAPIYTNRYHRTVLRGVMKDFGYPLELLGEMPLDYTSVEKIYKEKKLSVSILKIANKWVNDYIKELGNKKYNLGKAQLITKGKTNEPQIKGGKPTNRIEFVIQFPEVGRDSRDSIFIVADSLKGKYKTTFTNKNIQSSAGSVVHSGTGDSKRKDLEIWVAFKGGKSSKSAGQVSTDVKEGFVGLFFQSKWKDVVDKTNIGKCVSTLQQELKSIKGEGNSTKKELGDYLRTIPSSNPKKGFLDELNQPLSVALSLKDKYSSWKWERDSDFNKVRSIGSKICKVPADKWNPGDAYLVKGSVVTTTGPGTNITTQIAPLNNQFVTEWGKSDGNVVGVSLKQQSAQAGKGKTYLKSFDDMTKQFDYNLTKNERERLNIAEDEWVGAYIQQIDEWRTEIKSALSGLSISYDYSPAGSLFDSAAESFSKGVTKTVYQKYASIKMFKFMVNALGTNENMFVDSAAFASGLTGYSTTFFKAKSNKSGAKAKIETFEGSGGLELVGNKIKIEDTNANAGVTFTFKVKNNVMGTAEVKMNIRFNGSTQATLELLSVSWK